MPEPHEDGPCVNLQGLGASFATCELSDFPILSFFHASLETLQGSENPICFWSSFLESGLLEPGVWRDFFGALMRRQLGEAAKPVDRWWQPSRYKSKRGPDCVVSLGSSSAFPSGWCSLLPQSRLEIRASFKYKGGALLQETRSDWVPR